MCMRVCMCVGVCVFVLCVCMCGCVCVCVCVCAHVNSLQVESDGPEPLEPDRRLPPFPPSSAFLGLAGQSGLQL